MTSNYYIVKTNFKGVQLLIINDFKSKIFSLTKLLKADEHEGNLNDSLQLKITNSHIVIATTQNEKVYGKFKSSIKVIKVPNAEM